MHPYSLPFAKAAPAAAPPIASGGVLQRSCACGQHSPGDGECAECRKKRLATAPAGLQRSALRATPSNKAPLIVHEVLRSPGQLLDPATRAYMEPRFGHDFSQVRVHTGERAAQSAQAVNALAYTVGQVGGVWRGAVRAWHNHRKAPSGAWPHPCGAAEL